MGTTTKLKILEPYEAKKMLGVFLAIDGNNSTQIKHMRRIAYEWSEKVRVGHLTQFDTLTAFNTIVMKTLEYPLLVGPYTNDPAIDMQCPVCV